MQLHWEQSHFNNGYSARSTNDIPIFHIKKNGKKTSITLEVKDLVNKKLGINLLVYDRKNNKVCLGHHIKFIIQTAFFK